MNHNIILLCLVVISLAEVSADQTKTALIASGCVAGGLLVFAVAIGGLYCFIRYRRRVEKKPLPRYNDGGPMVNGVYRTDRTIPRSNISTGQLSDLRKESRNIGAKAFTQHAQSPRQRPPVPFYTMRIDPRQHPELPGVIHMGPTMYSRPPQVGRPVFFLDRKEPTKTKANGGPFIKSGSNNDERARSHPNRESRQDKKARSRSQSRSRSREPKMLTRRHSDTFDTSVLGLSGEIILRKKTEDFTNYSKSFRQVRRDDNNNPFALYFVNNNNTADISLANEGNRSTKFSSNKYGPEEGRYSVTQISTNDSIHPYMKITHSSHSLFQEREETIEFGEESDDISSTPRKDYPNDSPKSSDILIVSRKDITERRKSIGAFPFTFTNLEDLPRADYMSETNQKSENFKINSGEIDDIIALSAHSTYYTKDDRAGETSSYRQNNSFRRSVSPTSRTRPSTPPFDSGDVVFPSRIPSSQRHEETSPTAHKLSRIPTPPPDMSPDREDNPLSNFLFQTPPRPPPAPPMPVGNIKYHPPTPPPGLIKSDPDYRLGDIPNATKQPSSSDDTRPSKTPTDGRGREGGLPFMEELKRRQKSIDEGVAWSSQSSISSSIILPRSSSPNDQKRGSFTDSVSTGTDDGRSPSSDSPKHGLPHRTSVVQFADEPPEIIPHEEDYSALGDDPESPKILGIGTAASQPPPPPPPPSITLS